MDRSDESLTLHAAPPDIDQVTTTAPPPPSSVIGDDKDGIVHQSSGQLLDDIDTMSLVPKEVKPSTSELQLTVGVVTTAALKRKARRQLEDLIEKPAGKGPFTCRVCFTVFTGWAGYKRHQKGHLENDR